MDFIDSTRIVFNRVKRLEPEIATEIIGCILLQEPCEQDMVHLAVCPDVLFQEVICRVKADLHLVALKLASTPITPSMNSLSVDEVPFQYAPPYSPFSPCASFHFPPPYWDQHQHHLMPNKHGLDIAPLGYSDSVNEIQNQSQILGLQEQMEQVNLGTSGSPNEFYYPDPALSNFGARSNRRFNRFPEIPVKSCHYFNKGFCKHGNNCRYLHDREAAEGYSRMFGHNLVDGGFVEDHVLSPGSLQKLELEIVELLKSRRGNPISIASLPMLYHETYQKALQGDGYLTESQRHGKAGYSLTKLLARLKNSIRLIDRPHGQHAVILAEDAPKYMDNWNDRSDPGPIVSGSRQIYLTFPAESTFSEDDVSNYFSTYGPVEDVRIPCQQKRMFGFVTFASADTVKTILGKGNPHFVCGARVLVKPYREKSKLGDRKYQERMVHPMYFSRYLDMDSGIHSVGRGYETVRFFRKQHILEQKQALELERRRLAGPHLMRKPLVPQQFYGSTLENFRVSEDHLNFPSEEHFSYLLDVLNSGSNADDRVQHAENIHADQQSCEGLNLPDSPLAFAAPVASGNSSNA